MKKLMHIIATPREEESQTLQISEEFLKSFKESHEGWVFDELNLAKEQLPSMNLKRVDGKYMLLEGKDLFGEAKNAWNEVIQHIDRFRTADLYLVSSPMWNFTVPYMLKHYIDLIVQPKFLFRYTESGSVEGLINNKPMVIVTSSGGKYTEKMQKFDFLEPYFRTIFGFIGIENIAYIKAEPMDMGEPLKDAAMKKCQKEARELGKNIVIPFIKNNV